MIRIRPAIKAWEEHPEDFEALAEGLREQGQEVELVEPEPLPKELEHLDVQAAGMDVLIDVLMEVKDEVIGLVIGELIRRVGKARKKRGEKRQTAAVIYGPDGEVLTTVSVDDKRVRGHP